jgi:hypothetical protein
MIGSFFGFRGRLAEDSILLMYDVVLLTIRIPKFWRSAISQKNWIPEIMSDTQNDHKVDNTDKKKWLKVKPIRRVTEKQKTAGTAFYW